MIRIITSFLALCALLLSACSSGEIENKQSPNPLPVSGKNLQEITKSNHIKPGAAIDFVHSYGGKSEVGQQENIRLSFTESYHSGQMRIMLSADKALQLKSAQQDFIFNMASQQAHEIEISVAPQSEGKFYVNIFTSALPDESQSPKTRVFSIAFYVGGHSDKQSVAHKSSSENIRMLPSQEMVAD